MSDQDVFERILTTMYDAMLDDARWPAASALIDDACGIEGNDLMVGEGSKDDVRALFVAFTVAASAAKTWSESTSNATIPPTSACHASANCPTVVWCTSPTCSRPKS